MAKRDHAWDRGFVAGVLSAMQCVATSEGADSTLGNEIARACGPELLVRHADVHDLEMLRATTATKNFVRPLRRLGARAWYKPAEWLGGHRALGAFIRTELRPSPQEKTR